MALGILTNCLEEGGQRAKMTVGGALVPPSVPGGTLLPLLATVLRALLQQTAAAVAAGAGKAAPPAGPASNGKQKAEAEQEAAVAAPDEQRAMERQVSAAYVALVVGFLCRGAPDHCAAALAALGEAAGRQRRLASPGSPRHLCSSPQSRAFLAAFHHRRAHL
jgi:hypothetical protein